MAWFHNRVAHTANAPSNLRAANHHRQHAQLSCLRAHLHPHRSSIHHIHRLRSFRGRFISGLHPSPDRCLAKHTPPYLRSQAPGTPPQIRPHNHARAQDYKSAYLSTAITGRTVDLCLDVSATPQSRHCVHTHLTPKSASHQHYQPAE